LTWVQTGVTGKKFSLTEPKPKDVHIEDIAGALAKINRFAGNTAFPYSVAQHSVGVLLLVEEDLGWRLAGAAGKQIALMALLHDAAEAYIGDIPKPVKVCIPELEKLEMRILQCVYSKLVRGWDMLTSNEEKKAMRIIKRADDAMLAMEAERMLLRPPVENWHKKYKREGISFPSWGALTPLNSWSWSRASEEFMRAFKKAGVWGRRCGV